MKKEQQIHQQKKKQEEIFKDIMKDVKVTETITPTNTPSSNISSSTSTPTTTNTNTPTTTTQPQLSSLTSKKRVNFSQAKEQIKEQQQQQENNKNETPTNNNLTTTTPTNNSLLLATASPISPNGSFVQERLPEKLPEKGIWSGDTEYTELLNEGSEENYVRYANPLYNIEINYYIEQEDPQESLNSFKKKCKDYEERIKDLEQEQKVMKKALDNYRYPKKAEKGQERVEDPVFVKRENEQLKTVIDNLKSKLKDINIKRENELESSKLESREKDTEIDNYQRLYKTAFNELQIASGNAEVSSKEAERSKKLLEDKNEMIEKNVRIIKRRYYCNYCTKISYVCTN